MPEDEAKPRAEDRISEAPSPLESALVFLMAGGFVALVGALAVTQNSVSWRALAAVAHAIDVLRQEDNVNLALVGFAEPPLPTLLYLPLVWLFRGLALAGHTVWILGAPLAGATLSMLNSGCADLGLARAGRWALCTVVLLSPIFLGVMATGAPDGLYLFLLLAAGWALLRWQRRQALRDLIACSLLLSLAIMTRYDAVGPVLVATFVVMVHTLRTGGGWSKLEGTLITFLLPIVYVAGLWLLANRLIMGDAWHFVKETYQTQAPAQISQIGTASALLVQDRLVFSLALWAIIAGGACGRRRLATGPGLMLLSSQLVVGFIAHVVVPLAPFRQVLVIHDGLRLLTQADGLAPILAAGVLLTASVLPDLRLLCRGKSYFREALIGAGAVAVIFGATIASGPEWRLYLDPRPAFIGLPLGADDASCTKAVARRIRAEAPEGTLVAAGWPGYAVMLYAGRVKNKVLFPSPFPPPNVRGLRADGGVLIRSGSGANEAQSLKKQWEKALGSRLWLVFSQDGWAYFRPVGPR